MQAVIGVEMPNAKPYIAHNAHPQGHICILGMAMHRNSLRVVSHSIGNGSTCGVILNSRVCSLHMALCLCIDHIIHFLNHHIEVKYFQ